MNTHDEGQNDTRNPFPEPQTIPAGWDTSVFLSAAESETVGEDDSPES